MLPTEFGVYWSFGSGQEAKIDLQDGSHGGHLGFPIRMIKAVLIYSLRCFLSFQNNWPFVSGEEAKNIFSRRLLISIYHWNNFSYFYLQATRCILPCFKSTGLSVQEKKRKINFQDGGHGGHLRFRIGTILSSFALQCFLPSFKSIGLMVQEKK